MEATDLIGSTTKLKRNTPRAKVSKSQQAEIAELILTYGDLYDETKTLELGALLVYCMQNNTTDNFEVCKAGANLYRIIVNDDDTGRGFFAFYKDIESRFSKKHTTVRLTLEVRNFLADAFMNGESMSAMAKVLEIGRGSCRERV